MRHLRWILILFLLSIAAWRLAPHLGDFSKIIALKDQINPIWIILALISQIGQYVGDGWLSKTLLKIIGFKINFKQTIRIASLNVFAANVLPIGEAGSLATVFYFYKKLGVTVQQIIFLSLSWSIITASVLLFVFLLSLLFLPELPNIPISTTYLVIISIFTIFTVLDFFILEKKIVLPFIKKIIYKYFGKYSFYEELRTFKKNVPKNRKILFKDKIMLAQAVSAAATYYFANIATLSFSFMAFGHTPNLAIIAFAYAISLLLGWLTLAPAGIGTAEATLILIFLHFNIDAPVVLASVLVFRFMNFWLPIPSGAISYFSLKREIGQKFIKIKQSNQI